MRLWGRQTSLFTGAGWKILLQGCSGQRLVEMGTPERPPFLIHPYMSDLLTFKMKSKEMWNWKLPGLFFSDYIMNIAELFLPLMRNVQSAGGRQLLGYLTRSWWTSISRKRDVFPVPMHMVWPPPSWNDFWFGACMILVNITKTTAAILSATHVLGTSLDTYVIPFLFSKSVKCHYL